MHAICPSYSTIFQRLPEAFFYIECTQKAHAINSANSALHISEKLAGCKSCSEAYQSIWSCQIDPQSLVRSLITSAHLRCVYGTMLTHADMNEPWTLSAYKQMLLFQNNNRHPSLVFENPSHAQQDVLQSLAHREDLGLEYEYNLVARMAFISRPLPETERHLPELHDNSYLQAPITLDSLDLAISTSNVKPPPFLAHTEPMTFDEDLFFPQSSARSNIDFRDYSPLSNVIEMPEHSMLEDYIHDQPSYTPLVEDQSNSMETVLFCDTPHNNYMSRLDLRSRAGSINSQGRGRVGKMLSRVSSSRSTAGSMFSCFDSKSAQSMVTNTSASSRRSRKSMDSIAKAAMKAVKAVGACWRCKLLKKKVNAIVALSASVLSNT